jgi:hypothetical protein
MQYPIFDSHFYIGFFVLIWLAYDSYNRYRKSQNISTLYIACASFSLAISVFAFGFPALWTRDPKTLSVFTFIGDCTQIASFLFLWLLSIRAFLGSKPKIMFVANTVVFTLAIVSMIDAILRNLTPPYLDTKIVSVSSYAFDITYADSLRYSILTGLNSLSFFLLSFYFWKQGDAAPNSGQKIRIRGLAIAFFITSLVFVVMPAIPYKQLFDIKDGILTIIFLIIAISAIFGRFKSNASKSSSTN